PRAALARYDRLVALRGGALSGTPPWHDRSKRSVRSRNRRPQFRFHRRARGEVAREARGERDRRVAKQCECRVGRRDGGGGGPRAVALLPRGGGGVAEAADARCPHIAPGLVSLS